MSKKSKKVLKIVGVVVAAWLIISAVNVLVYKKVISSSNSSAAMDAGDKEPSGKNPEFGAGGGLGNSSGSSVSTDWYWAGPLCWINTDICW